MSLFSYHLKYLASIDVATAIKVKVAIVVLSKSEKQIL